MFQSKRSQEGEAAQESTGAGIRNRTGISMAPEMALDLIREAQKTPPSSKGDARVLAEYRSPYIREQEPVGSPPRPLDAGPGGDTGSRLLDKLGERLAFERQGVRLYEALIGKVKLLGKASGGPALADLEHILSEEREHFRFLQQAVVEAGGDPTVLTPCANIASVLSQGVVQVVTDPRTTVVQCLEALLVAELSDNDGWALLKQVTESAGAGDLLERIEEAEENEAEHLAMVRRWLSALVAGGLTSRGSASKPAAKSRIPGKAKTQANRPNAAAQKSRAKAAARPGSSRSSKTR